jgi:hypothetical protein
VGADRAAAGEKRDKKAEGYKVKTYTVYNLPEQTVQGIYEAHQRGEVDTTDVSDQVIVRSAALLAEKGYWMWLWTYASEETSTWNDLQGGYWTVDPDSGDIWSFVTGEVLEEDSDE